MQIESNAAFLQGIFGVGGEKCGKIKLLEIAADKEIEKGDIPEVCKGEILVGGCSPSIEALLAAQSRGALGFVTGSIDDQALRYFVGYDIGVALTGDEDVAMTLIITEGFGTIPLSLRVSSIIKEFNGAPASINGATQVRAGAVRPEIIIAHNQAVNEDAEKLEGLSIGRQIRIIRVPYFGQMAKVTELPKEPKRIETGAKCRVLKAKLESGEEVFVPRANVELV